MLQLFEPQTKVQKDRQIIRDTDLRMAKYSRRGLVTNLLIYTLCLGFAQTFIQEHQKLAIVLTLGLLLVTLARGYLLFRFDSIYPRAPASWRNKYFLATLIGTSWWGLIMASLTLIMNMEDEAALMWLYTVVFFSTTAHAFAPYRKFLSLYQFVGLVPAALCTFFIGEFIGVFYGCILLFFYWILNHHSELMSQNYWDRLDAHYTLARKAESLEEEKRDTRASVQLFNEYITLLSYQMHGLLTKDGSRSSESDARLLPVRSASLHGQLEQLYRNVDDFKQVITKELEAEPRLFNVRHFLQYIVGTMVEDAERKGVELDTALSPALPSRLVGDPRRIGQVVKTMLSCALRQTSSGVLFVEVEFLREYENSGELHVSIARQQTGAKRGIFQNEQQRPVDADLDFILARGIAEALNGHLESGDAARQDGKSLRFRVPMAVAERNARPEYHRIEYKGRTVMLIHSNARWLDHKRTDLNAMGFAVETCNQFKKATQALTEAVSTGKAIETVVYSATAGDDAAVQFCNALLSHNDLKYTQQIVMCTKLGERFFRERIQHDSSAVRFAPRPAGNFELEVCYRAIFDNVTPRHTLPPEGHTASHIANHILWVALDKDFEMSSLCQSDTTTILKVDDPKQVTKALEEHRFQLVVVERPAAEDLPLIQRIRNKEKQLAQDTLVPIVGVGSAEFEETLLEHGVDHFIDIESMVAGDMRELEYWLANRNH